MDCQTCERRMASNKSCQVLKSKPDNCWAWTDDKEWLEKVNEQVRLYRHQSKTMQGGNELDG